MVIPVLTPHPGQGTQNNKVTPSLGIQRQSKSLVSLPCCDDCQVNKEKEYWKDFNFKSLN